MTIHSPRTRDELARLLQPLRLQATVFQRAVHVAAAESRNFSEGAPVSGPESVRWFRMVEHVHLQLMKLHNGWRRTNPRSLPYFRQPKIGLGLIVSSGDELTGVAWGDPRTRNPKGAEFVRRVDNSHQEPLFEVTTPESDINYDDLWICLYDERDGMVHLELSRPRSMTGGHVASWADRIIFPAFDFTTGDFSFDEDSGDEGELGFTLSRR